MAGILGWKDILRPIRDGYRHLFPSPDTGPTPEEREKQRVQDALKGFAYFDTFDQLEEWDESLSDPLQRANTPLLPRPGAVQDEGGRASVLLCHDYAGNYHDYEHIQQVGVDDESYSCEYLQYVDTYVYFSHKLACIPPPSWTNSLHRNGVKVLGTLLVEPQTKEIERLLDHSKTEDGSLDFVTARKLADIATHYGFDGWLVNIEKPFPKDHWSAALLEAFLSQLKDHLGPHHQLLWYDAITVNNKVSYQNALTAQNVSFAKVCGGILTNYCWKESDAWSSKQLAREEGITADTISFGVDVWAQNTTKLTHPRVTYPENGGGGTKTGIAVAKLAEVGLSVGIFAPAWTFEHFPGHGRDIERAMWEGAELPRSITCSCGDANVRHPTNRESPVTQYAKRFPAGSDRFFYTDFSRAFGYHEEGSSNLVYGGNTMHAQLASQSILPQTFSSSTKEGEQGGNILSYRLESVATRTELLIEARNVVSMDAMDEKCSKLPLFNLDMTADGSLLLAASVSLESLSSVIRASFFLELDTGITLIPLERNSSCQTIEAIVGSGDMTAPSQLKSIGIWLEGPSLGQVVTRLLRVREVRIIPRESFQLSLSYSINNIRIQSRDTGDSKHWRLCWSHNSSNREHDPAGLPYSSLTGSFSYFIVTVNGVTLGRVYTVEYLLNEQLVDMLATRAYNVHIAGIGFDGRKLAEGIAKLQI